MGLLIAVLNLLLIALVLYLILLVVEWAVSLFVAIPPQILKIIRAIFGIVFLIYAVSFLASVVGGVGPPFLFDWRHR